MSDHDRPVSPRPPTGAAAPSGTTPIGKAPSDAAPVDAPGVAPHFDAYDRARARITALVTTYPGAGAIPVPACPGWTVHDVVSHLAGLAADVVAGNTEHYAAPEWTAEQVRRRAARSLGEVTAEWAETMLALRSAPLPPHLRGFGTLGHLVFVDAAIHEHDLRGVLDAPAPGNEAARVGLDSAMAMLARLLRRAPAGGRSGLRVRTDDGRAWALEAASPPGRDDPPAVELHAPAFELWRGLTGRRTRQQVRSLGWRGEPDAFLDHWSLGPLPFAATPLTY